MVMENIKINTLVESFSASFGRVVEVGNSYFVVHFSYVLSENKERIFTQKDIDEKRIIIHLE
jgi:hypothetical protein